MNYNIDIFFPGNGHGSHEEKSFVFQKPVELKSGENHLVMLGVVTGFPVRSKTIVII